MRYQLSKRKAADKISLEIDTYTDEIDTHQLELDRDYPKVQDLYSGPEHEIRF